MLDREMIGMKINSIQNCIQRIVEKTENTPDWISKFDLQDIVVLNLTRAVQLCVDLAGVIITGQKWGIPRTLAEAFTILHRNNVITQPLMQVMKKMVGFRNIATHAYKEIDYNIVKSIVENRLGDFEEFYTLILNYADGLEK